MKTYTAAELAEVIEKHGKWLRNEEGGERANLRGSDLRDSNLSDSDLRDSNLSDSDLRGSNLSDSDLRGSKNQIYITQRSDGYQFFAKHDGNQWMISAGCQCKTISDYRAHAADYNDPAKTSETLLILDFAEAMIKDRGIVSEPEKQTESEAA